MKEEISLLKDLGLTDHEVTIFLDLLKSGSSLASEITKRTQLNRSYVYERLQRLMERGLVSVIVKNKKKSFQAASPERLLLILKERELLLKELIPKLLQMQMPVEEAHRIEIFSGKEGMKTVIEEELTAKEILVIGSSPTFTEELLYYRPGFHKRRIELKIPMKVIFYEEDRTYGEKTGKMPYAETKFLASEYKAPLTIVLFNDVTLIALWVKPLLAIRIQNEACTEGFRKHFRLLWKIAKP